VTECDTLFKIIETHCLKEAQKPALRLTGETVTYGRLLQRIEEWAEFLNHSGVKAGDRILLVNDDRFDFISAWLAIWKVQAVAIPLEPTIAPDELARCWEVAKPQWIVAANHQHQAVIAQKALAMENPVRPEWIFARSHSSQTSPGISDGSFYIYTSGTTGTPKCVMYDQKTAAAIISSLGEAYQLSDSDVVCTPLTPSLSATLITGILPGLASGALLVLPDEPIPGKVLKLIKRHGVTIFFAVPYFYSLLIEAMRTRQEADWSSVRLALSTSAFLPQKVFEEFYELTKIPIRSIYCTSEANQCTFNSSSDLELLKHSVGPPQAGVELDIVAEKGEKRPAFAEGEIVVRGTHLSKGYFCRPDLEAKVYRNGWIFTGDLGFMNREGYLFITGRLSDTINVSGHLVNPQEVENVLNSHPAVREALVLGEFVDQMGEKVVGWVVPNEGQQALPEELIAYCHDKLIHYKIPSNINLVGELPKSRYGKIKRLTPLTQEDIRN
jgi:long-chain acyl-CoA synthetase